MDYARSELEDFIWILLGRIYPDSLTTAQVYAAVEADDHPVLAHYGDAMTSDGAELAWKKEVRWAHQILRQAGRSNSLEQGVWCLTPEGQRELVDAGVLD